MDPEQLLAANKIRRLAKMGTSGDQDPSKDYITVGDGQNETNILYRQGEGAHRIRFLNLISPDILLVHQSRMVGFGYKLGSNPTLEPVPRDVKDHILKEFRMRK